MVFLAHFYPWCLSLSNREGRWSRQGFSMIELMISMMVMGLLMSLLVPNMSFFQTRALDLAQKNSLNLIQLGIESYYLTHFKYPTTQSIDQLISLLNTEGSLKKSLKNPYMNQTYSSSDASGKIEYSMSNLTYSLIGYGKENKTIIFSTDD